MTFTELGISAPLCQAIAEMGFETPMPVQEAVIPHLLGSGKDIIALAQTGTGKTAAFGLPILQNIRVKDRYPQALILSPTRELCVQIAKDLANYAQYLPEIGVVAVYGGANIEMQIRQIERGMHIVVATPGRLLDLVRRGAIDLSRISDVVLDEADEMLNMGFSESLDAILQEIPSDRHLLLFSATMPAEIARITRKYMQQPLEVTVGERNVVNANIRHIYYMVHAKDKYLALKRIADYYPSIYGIIFCRTKRDTQEIADKLINDGYNADALHGDLSQQQRDYVMQKFRVRNLQLLVATDVAARGLDVDSLTHVIHFGLPDDPESYTHRSGRTARAGRSGISISICHAREKGRLRDIAKLTGVTFEHAPIPAGKEICEKQLFHFIDKLSNTLPDEERIAPYMEQVMNRLSWLDSEQIIRRVVYQEMERLIHYYEEAQEIEEVADTRREPLEPKERKTRSERKSGIAQKGYERLTINFGKRDKIYPNTLIDIINRCLDSFVEVGKIDIYESRAYFEVRKEDAHTVMQEMNDFELGGRMIHVEVAKPDKRQCEEPRGEYSRGKRDGKRRENRNFTQGFRREGKRKR